MDLTPIDILHVQFKKGLRGYGASQVDEFLRQVASQMEVYARENAGLQEQVERLSAEVNRCRELETTVQNALVLAQKTADELKAAAHHEAELILQEAQQKSVQQMMAAHDELAALKSQMGSLKAEKDRFELDFRSLIRSCSEWMDRQSARQADAAGEGS